MKLTKYEHACLVIKNDQSTLVIDPGCFTTLPNELSNVSCVVITEEHVDHFDIDNVRAITTQNPDAQIITTQAVKLQLLEAGIESQAISGTQTVTVGGYTLNLYETPHAAIYKKSPCMSLAVKVDSYLYYPSDTFRPVNEEVQILALPTSGPWHKLQEAIDLANSVKSQTILATHNGLYNDRGQAVANNFIKANIADANRQYIYLKPGESL